MRLAQLDRAFGYGPKGREFESSNARTLGSWIIRLPVLFHETFIFSLHEIFFFQRAIRNIYITFECIFTLLIPFV